MKNAGRISTADGCAALGVESLALGVDVSDFKAAQDLAGQVTEGLGPAHVLVNNAGLTRDGVFMRMSEDDWDRVLDVNLKGAFNVTRAFTRGLLKTRGARVINIASVVGLGGNAGQANYAASKAGIIGVTKAVAKELAGRGVTANAVAPGYIQTDMTADLPDGAAEGLMGLIPLGRMGTVEDIADVVAFLASEGAGYVTGQVIPVDGGMVM